MTEITTYKIVEFEDTPHLKSICFECSPDNGECRSATWNAETNELTFTDMKEGKHVSSFTISANDLEVVASFMEHILPDLLEKVS